MYENIRVPPPPGQPLRITFQLCKLKSQLIRPDMGISEGAWVRTPLPPHTRSSFEIQKCYTMHNKFSNCFVWVSPSTSDLEFHLLL